METDSGIKRAYRAYEVIMMSGTPRYRQDQANCLDCVAFVVQRFGEAWIRKTVGFSSATVTNNATMPSLAMAHYYANAISKVIGVDLGPNEGIKMGGKDQKLIRYTNMPAFVAKPLFCSNKEHAEMIKSEEGQTALATVLAETIVKFYPLGGKIALSNGGHLPCRWRWGKPKDHERLLGAKVVGGGWETDYAQAILTKTAEQLSRVNKCGNAPDDQSFFDIKEVRRE